MPVHYALAGVILIGAIVVPVLEQRYPGPLPLAGAIAMALASAALIFMASAETPLVLLAIGGLLAAGGTLGRLFPIRRTRRDDRVKGSGL